ncbi:hypothetical protein HED49_10480 [Ochrobactrum daejeonense]|nr:hypothetical protein [Brucella daejeonensis]
MFGKAVAYLDNSFRPTGVSAAEGEFRVVGSPEAMDGLKRHFTIRFYAAQIVNLGRGSVAKTGIGAGYEGILGNRVICADSA